MGENGMLFVFFQQLCHREPGVTLPETLEKDWESPALPMKTATEGTSAILRAIWEGFYMEKPLSAEQQHLLMALSWQDGQNHSTAQDLKLAKLTYGVAKLTLGYDLAKQLRYKSALSALEPLASEALFGESIHWENHLNQKLGLVRCSTQPALSARLKGQALWEAVSRGKRAFEDSGQWRAAIWQEVQRLKILSDDGREAELKWLASTLKEQARYYQWEELDLYLGETLADLAREAENPFGFADFEFELPLMMARLSQHKAEGAVEVFIGLSRVLSKQLEELGRYQEANAVLRGWLEIYEDGGTL